MTKYIVLKSWPLVEEGETFEEFYSTVVDDKFWVTEEVILTKIQIEKAIQDGWLKEVEDEL